MQELILLKSVDSLGRPGGVVKVKNGYAHNFLLPQGLAVLATKDNLRRLEKLRARFEVEEKERESRARSLSERIETTSITVPMKASEEGHLYGSVSISTIVDSLKEQGVEIEARWVRLTDPIKEIGRYEVPIQLHEEIRVDLKVWVVEEKSVSDEVEATEGSEAPADPAAAS